MNEWTRRPAVAGTFYPSDAKKLERMLDELVPQPNHRTTVRAVIVPHAGYVYSGETAGVVYRQIQVPESVFVLCPNHSGLGPRISVWSRGIWQTPLGEVRVGEELANQFLELLPEASSDREAHLHEHAIEVHLPFLQWINPKTTIIPVVLGPLQLDQCERVGVTLAKIFDEQTKDRLLLVASTDMSHYISADEAKRMDQLALREIERVRPAELYQTVVQHDISMCGFIPTTCVLDAMARQRSTRAEILHYSHSGLVTHDFNRVVSYVSAWIK